MKEYEQYKDIKTIKNMPIIIRLDGRSFSKQTKLLNLIKPFDIRLRNLFIDVSIDLIKEGHAKYIYTFSDEINILLTEIPFKGRVEKLDSIFASFTASSFTKNLFINKNNFKLNENQLKPISFDSRIIQFPNKLNDYFKWRQNESWRNCLNSYAQAILNKKYTPKKTAELLYKLNKSDLNELIYKEGININNVPLWQKRGVTVYNKKELISGFDPIKNHKTTSYRNKIFVDTKINLF